MKISFLLTIAAMTLFHTKTSAQATRFRGTETFRNVRITGPFQLTLTPASKQGIEQPAGSADGDILLEKDKDTLVIRAARADMPPVAINLLYRELESLTAKEIVSITGHDVIEGKNFALSASGAHTVSLAFKTNNTALSLDGNGNYTFRGQTRSLAITLQGSGFVDALALTCSTSNVRLIGAGKIHLNPGENLSVKAEGNGEIGFKPSPKRQMISGDHALVHELP